MPPRNRLDGNPDQYDGHDPNAGPSVVETHPPNNLFENGDQSWLNPSL
jgi:hypothetical protein